MSVGSARVHVPTTALVALLMSRRLTISGLPGTPTKSCSNVYQPDTVTWTGAWPGSAGFAPQRVALLPPEITKPSGSVPALKTKARRHPSDVVLIADEH